MQRAEEGIAVNKRVVVTGMGIVSPLGIGVKENWDSLCQAKSGIGTITKFLTYPDPSKEGISCLSI